LSDGNGDFKKRFIHVLRWNASWIFFLGFLLFLPLLFLPSFCFYCVGGKKERKLGSLPGYESFFVHLDMHLWPRACLARDVLSFYVALFSVSLPYLPIYILRLSSPFFITRPFSFYQLAYLVLFIGEAEVYNLYDCSFLILFSFSSHFSL
jgi:hypothetical protein